MEHDRLDDLLERPILPGLPHIRARHDGAGIFALVGSVPNEEARLRALGAAAAAPGVRAVRDELLVVEEEPRVETVTVVAVPVELDPDDTD
jgi:hypothetical protein